MQHLQRHIIVILMLLIGNQFSLFGQSKLNIQLLDNWDSDTIIHNSTNVKFSDVWGYAHQGREYALIASTEGIHTFEIVNDKLRFVDFEQATFAHVQVTNRDVTTYKQYAYTGADHGNSNLQIIDLSYLPDSTVIVAEIDSLFGRIHNLFVDEENALLYACRITPIVNGLPTSVIPLRVFSLANPLDPQLVWEGPTGISEVHDIWVQNQIAVLNCGFDGMRVYDFTNPSAPIYIQNITTYQDQGYNHQGAMTPDGTKYILGDETNGKLLKLWEVGLDHKLTYRRSFGTNHQNGSIPHNIMCSNELAFVAYYNEGLRIFDISKAPVREIAHYDTYPLESNFKMNGAWGVYTALPSQRILISDIQYGLFLFDFNRELFSKDVAKPAIYPTYITTGEQITIRLEDQKATSFIARIYDLNGKKMSDHTFNDQTFGIISPNLSQGMYILETVYFDAYGEEQKHHTRLLFY